MTADLIALLIAVMFSLGFMSAFFVGKKIGMYQTLKEIEEQDIEFTDISDISSSLSKVIYSIKESNRVAISIQENEGKIPTKEIYDVIYSRHVNNGKLVCEFKDPDSCKICRLLREYREEHPEILTKEELQRNDGL